MKGGGIKVSRIKSIRIGAINWCTQFTEELVRKGWRVVKTASNDLTVFENDRHIIRVSKIWG